MSPTVHDEPISRSQVVDEVIRHNRQIADFWRDGARGWAPNKAADLLSGACLDNLGSLSTTLHMWLDDPGTGAESRGRLILAWTNLGALVEGTLTWFLCVWEDAYSQSPLAARSGRPLEADELLFAELCRYYSVHVWVDSEKHGWDSWLNRVRHRRNCIHALGKQDVGTWEEFWTDVVVYRDMVQELDSRVPYPEVPR